MKTLDLRVNIDNKRFQELLEVLPTGVVMSDRAGEIIFANRDAEKMFGYPHGELKGLPIEVLVPMKSRAQHPKMRAEYYKSPERRRMGQGKHLMGVRYDGSEIPVEVGLSPLEVSGQSFVMASIIDISERKQFEEKLQLAYEEVQLKNEEMEQFVYTVSHDLKAPLVTCVSFFEFLKEDIAEGRLSDVAHTLSRLERAHKKMQELINDLLDLSRVGRMENDFQVFSPQTVVLDVLNLFSEDLIRLNVSIDLQEHLPSVWADQRRVYQIFENLIGNALKYGSSHPSPRLQISGRTTATEVIYSVKDNGKGIDPAFHQKIFGLFERLETDQDGTGVGLAIVARIMKTHGGRVWVESESGQGAEFFVAFPLYINKGKGNA